MKVKELRKESERESMTSQKDNYLFLMLFKKIID